MKKINKKQQTQKDVMKATKRANREMEYELLGAGWHAKHKVVQSKKVYNRKKMGKVDIA